MASVLREVLYHLRHQWYQRRQQPLPEMMAVTAAIPDYPLPRDLLVRQPHGGAAVLAVRTVVQWNPMWVWVYRLHLPNSLIS